jgi:hypothetical protein
LPPAPDLCQAKEISNKNVQNMGSRLISFFILLLVYSGLNAQKIGISGYVKDSKTGETLIAANVVVKEKNLLVTTNNYGYYTLQVEKGSYTILVNYLGYKSKEIRQDFQSATKLDFTLDPLLIEGKEVEVTAEKQNSNVTNNEMSKMRISAEKVKELPALFGEVDILKTITLLPGIKSGGEGSTGFYVRGGGPDQNLILLDEAVIYNPSHLLGFFSVFNADAIKNIEIMKGGMPAQYGGRLSSILNITMKEGNNQEFKVSGGIGLISSRLMLEGPIKKNKSSFMLTARRTYIDWLVQPFLKPNLKGNRYYFYDLNFKANYIVNDKNRLFLSGYWGDDIFRFKSPDLSAIKFSTGWGNKFASLRWNHIFSSKLFLNTSVIYNQYQLETKASFQDAEFKLFSGLHDWNAKMDFNYSRFTRHKILFGVNYIYHTFVPGIASFKFGGASSEDTVKINNLYAHEAAAYINDEWDVNEKLNIQAGIRYSYFNQVGPYTQKIFDEHNAPTGRYETYPAGYSLKLYQGWAPRLNMRYAFNDRSSVKASITKVDQFLHLATTSGATLPSDLWIPSSRLVKPQLAWQYAAGYYRNFLDNLFETSIEAYYKKMDNQIEFKPGAQLFFNANLEKEVIEGKGESYGVELFIKKNKGKLTGWIGYTLSRSNRTFDFSTGLITYPYRYDRTHDASLVLSYELSKKWNANFVFVYGTGTAITLPFSGIIYNVGVDLKNQRPTFSIIDNYNYDRINGTRLPAYHRADISVNYKAKTGKRFESFWNFAVYNIYNRANPYFVYALTDEKSNSVKYKMVYLFPVMPSVTYNFKF